LAEERTYTTADISRAATELRDAAGTEEDREPFGSEEERVNTEEAIRLLAEEIRLMRERGFSDDRIADLLQGFDIDVTAKDIASVEGEPELT
jgi:hypothetical protein